jgi:hypothetical protein
VAIKFRKTKLFYVCLIFFHIFIFTRLYLRLRDGSGETGAGNSVSAPAVVSAGTDDSPGTDASAGTDVAEKRLRNRFLGGDGQEFLG